MNKILIIAIIAVAIVGFIGWTLPNRVNLGGTTSDDWNVGGNLAVTGTSALTGALTQTGAATLSNTLNVSGETHLDNLIYGGGRLDLATSSRGGASSTALTAADVCNNSVIAINPEGTGWNLYSPASSSLSTDCLTTVGDEKEVLLYNSCVVTACDITVNASTAVTTMNASSSAVLVKNAWAKLKFVFASSTAIIMLLDMFK